MPDYQHRPEQGPMNEKSFFLYVGLAFLLVVLMRPLLVKQSPPAPKPASETNQPAQQASPTSAAKPAGISPNASSNASPNAIRPPSVPAIPPKQAIAETEIVVENDIYRITFTNRGAQVKSWVLKKYKDDKGNPLDLV